MQIFQYKVDKYIFNIYMIIYLYGLPGVGKNYIGEIFKNKFNFNFIDADDYLPTHMKTKLKNEEHFTKEEVSNYHKIIAYNIFKLKSLYSKLVISQASLFRDHRKIIKNLNTEINFIHIRSDIDTINKRIVNRNGYVTQKYSNHLQKFLEVGFNDKYIENNSDTSVEDLINIISDLLKNFL